MHSAACEAVVPDHAGAVLASALEAVISIDAGGRVRAWNGAAADTFGYPIEHACGHLLEELILPVRYRAAHRAGLQRLAAGGAARVLGQRLQLEALHGDGHEFPIELTLSATDGPDGRLFHAFAHDVSVRRRAERFTATQAAVSRALAEAPNTAQAGQSVVDAVAATLGWPVTELWLLDEPRTVLRCAARHTTGAGLSPFNVDEMEGGVGVPGAVWATGSPVWVPDLATDTSYPRSVIAARLGLHVALGVPICTSTHVQGVLACYGEHIEDPEDTLITLLAGIAAHVGQYLQRRHAEELTVELARTKDEFVALVTHELCNPLSIITSTAGMFAEEVGELSVEQQRQYLHAITRNADRLTVMAADLLDLARLESCHLDIAAAPTDLCRIITDATRALQPVIADKDLTLHLDIPERVILPGDEQRLYQVIDNLLSNAVKYTPRGGAIAIHISTDEDQVTWTVADTGIGIPPAERGRLFQRFYRASTALEHRIPGTGLGLVIIRTIIERHHGTITLTDHDGPGTTFLIHLPTTHPAAPVRPTPSGAHA